MNDKEQMMQKLAQTMEQVPEGKRKEIQRFVEGYTAGLETAKEDKEATA